MKTARELLPALIVLAIICALAPAQETNSAAGALDVNGSTSSGQAPYTVMIEQPTPLQITVTGAPNQPWVLISGAATDVGNTVYPSGQIDVGPSPMVVLDGISGPFSPYLANTGPGGSQTIQISVPNGSVPTGTTFAGLQAAVIDPTSPPYFVTLTAATSFGFMPNSSVNAPPIADPGPAIFADGGRCVTLDASASLDPEGSGLTYSWNQLGGTTVMLSSMTDAMPTFTTPAGNETLVFELTVNDGMQDSEPALLFVIVQSAPTTVSFMSDIVPLFNSSDPSYLGCNGCHGSVGGLTLSGTPSSLYSELTDPAQTQLTTYSGSRSNPCDPMNSPMLTRPLGASHNTFFSGTSDPAYVTILTWIMEGAQNN